MSRCAISVTSLGGQKYLVPADAILDYWPSLDDRIIYVLLSRASDAVAVFAKIQDMDRAYAEIMQCPVPCTSVGALGRHHCDLFDMEAPK